MKRTTVTTNIRANHDFTCKNCGYFVSAQNAVSGVVHRNHCPCCLYSRHMDLFKAGDRLCACKGLMAPVSLTLKQSRDKYARRLGGELMVVHQCIQCGALSINRIAADDDPIKLIGVLDKGIQDPQKLREQCCSQEIRHLKTSERRLVFTQLFGFSDHDSYQKYLTDQFI